MKKFLIAGCSHAAGAEIDGSQDSFYNREHSFGNQLAGLLGRQPVNISSSGSTNATIARDVLEWCNKNLNDDLFVLVSWTESSRLEVPVDRIQWYELENASADWFSEHSRPFLRINQGWTGADSWEKDLLPRYQEFIAENLTFMEIYSANLVLQLQYYFKSNNIKYLMTNSMHMFGNSKQLASYIDKIDKSSYYNCLDNEQSFYWKYKNLGYTNPKAKYWHHGETPHSLYAKELFDFLNEKNS